jgi:hypothetical protein
MSEESFAEGLVENNTLNEYVDQFLMKMYEREVKSFNSKVDEKDIGIQFWDY